MIDSYDIRTAARRQQTLTISAFVGWVFFLTVSIYLSGNFLSLIAATASLIFLTFWSVKTLIFWHRVKNLSRLPELVFSFFLHPRTPLILAFISLSSILFLYIEYKEISLDPLDQKKPAREILLDRNSSITERMKSLHKIAKDLPGLSLTNTYLSELPLNELHIDLSFTDLRNANLSKSILDKTELIKADLSGANLTLAQLRWVNLTKANLRSAVLSNTNLEGSLLVEVSFTHTDLSNTNLYRANLSKAKLSKAKNLTQEQINSAFYCEEFPPTLSAELKPPPKKKCDEYGFPIEEYRH